MVRAAPIVSTSRTSPVVKGDTVSDHIDTPDESPHAHHDMRSRRYSSRLIFLLVFAVVIAAIAFTGVVLGRGKSAEAATITVTGSGTVTGTPNTVSFQIGVSTTAASANAALSENNQKTAALEATLLKNGITKKNLQTSGLDIYDNTNAMGTIISFTAQDNLNVTSHDIAKVGSAIDAAAKSVGNGIQLSGITFSISNQSKYLAAARARAIRNAHTEASQIATGGGTTVGRIVKVTDEENTGSGGVVLPFSEFASAAGANRVPVQAGSQSINVQVEVVYSLAS
jgi:uncharacterized protein YggE